jgi:hypothetical protein
MKRRKRTVTVTETHSVTIIKSSGGTPCWCPECDAEVWMASAEQAAVLSGVSARAVYRRIEAGEVHFFETPLGALRVCLHSLLGGSSALVAEIDAGAIDTMIESETVS